MELQKINVKFFAEEKAPVPLTAFIDIFHGWIQATDGVYHDVADYSHMQAGPGIVLVAYEANVSVDETGGRRGLLYSQKAALAGSNPEKLRRVMRAALENCRRLEEEAALEGKLKFRAHEAEISINDRLVAPNSEETYSAVQSDVEKLLGQLYGGSASSLERENDPRKRLSLRIKATAPFEIATLLRNLEWRDNERAVHY
jgi:hypothetical protein